MKALIIVDMQNDFISMALGTSEAKAIVEDVQKQIVKSKQNGYDIIYTQDTHFDDYLSTNEGKNLQVPHCIKGSEGWQIESSLDKTDSIIFEKNTFGSVELAEYIKKKGYSEVELLGICTDICVISNALLIKAFSPEIEVSLHKNLCAGVTVDTHNAALTTMAMCQIKMLD